MPAPRVEGKREAAERPGKAPPPSLGTFPGRGGLFGAPRMLPLRQKTALEELILKGCWVILGKLLVFGADHLADDVDDVLGGEAVVT